MMWPINYLFAFLWPIVTERTAVAESVAKKLCFAGEESGVGSLIPAKNTRKHVENTWLCRHFSLVAQGKTRKTREKRGWNRWTKIDAFGLGWMQLVNCACERLRSI